jgi:hypothetical protein
MKFLKKAAFAAAAFSMVASPVAASAQFDGLRASSDLAGAASLQDGGEGGFGSWGLLLVAVGLMFGGLATGLGNSNSAPVSA